MIATLSHEGKLNASRHGLDAYCAGRTIRPLESRDMDATLLQGAFHDLRVDAERLYPYPQSIVGHSPIYGVHGICRESLSCSQVD